ncbi:MAG: sigma 54-interacting transcriptional regulator [Limnobacter sp.]|nr:sigma 54-interacting transcriptional regulator [Limnobacter sp.]
MINILICIESEELRSRLVAAAAILQANLIERSHQQLLSQKLKPSTWLITDYPLSALRTMIQYVRKQGLDPSRCIIRLIDKPWYEYCYHDIPIFASLVKPQDALSAAEVIQKLSLTLPFEQTAESEPLEESDPFHSQFVRSLAMRQLVESASRIAKLPVDTVLLGPTGAGKDTIAQWLHKRSKAKGRFIHVNCAALPDTLFEGEMFGSEAGAYTGATKDRAGLIEQAHQGTLYLDEIDSLNLQNQAKLLTALQYRGATRLGGQKFVSSEFRVIASTKVDLERMVELASFRQDLYFRLNVSTLRIPALHERLEDILQLYRHFLKEAGNAYHLPIPELSVDEEDHLLSHHWPGNIRELKAFAQKHVIGFVPFDFKASRPAFGLKERLLAYEKAVLQTCIDRNKGSIRLASQELGIAPHSLYYRLKKLEDLGEISTEIGPEASRTEEASSKLKFDGNFAGNITT